jgi:hypothetical protein
MPYTEVFEDSKVKLKVKIKKGPKKAPKCTFKFEVTDGDAIPDEKGKVNGEYAECTVKVPLCKEKKLDDDSIQEFYTFSFKVIDEDDNNAEYPGVETYRVWPRNVKVTLHKLVKDKEEPFPGCEFRLTQKDEKDIKAVMPKKAPFEGKRQKPGPIKLVPDANYMAKTWKKGAEDAGREREAVLDASFEAAFLNPTSGTKIEQYVNHESDVNKFGTDGKGKEVRITVGAKDDIGVDDPANRKAFPGADVFIKVTFTRSSKRIKPKVGIKGIDDEHPIKDLKKSADLKTWTGRVVIGDDKTASFVVKLGMGGGEECKVEIGVEKDKPQDTLEFQNWRKIDYELWQPKADGGDKMTDYTNFKADKSAGLSTASTDFFKKTLDKLFIKFLPYDAAKPGYFLVKADIPLAGVHNVIDADYVNKDAGKEVLVLELDMAKDILDAKAVKKTDPRIVCMIWCDHLCDPKSWNDTYQIETNNTELNLGDLRVFKTAVVAHNGVAHGGYPIKKISWRATHYKDGTWKPITGASDPGGAHRNNHDISTEADIKAHVEFLKFDKIKFKLPTAKAGFPGKDIGLNGTKLESGGKEIRISVVIQGAATEMGFNGAALQGTVWMNTHSGGVHPVGMGRTVLHELGHNMGMAYGSKRNLKVRGQPDTNQIPGIPFPKPLPKGFVYDDDWGHTGAHCAHGCSEATRKHKDFPKNPSAWNERDCIMYGSGDMSLSKEFSFCPLCSDYITGQNLESIRKNWKT